MEFYEAVVGELTLPARKGQSSRSSNSQVRLPCFLGSGHWICALRSRHLTGSKAAGTAIGDDVGMRFERCVKEFTCRSNGQNLAQAAGRTLASRIKRGLLNCEPLLTVMSPHQPFNRRHQFVAKQHARLI
jgi:hypothetical protein